MKVMNEKYEGLTIFTLLHSRDVYHVFSLHWLYVHKNDSQDQGREDTSLPGLVDPWTKLAPI